MPILAHLGDVHLGAAFGFLPAQAAAACRAAHLDALRHAVEQASDLGAAALLVPGDLFDSPIPPLPLFSQTMDILSRAHCPVLISPGNHDYLHPGSPYLTASVPPTIHIFKSPRLEPFPLGSHTVVWGAAFCDMSATIPLEVTLDASQLNVLCVHAELYSKNAYNPILPDMLAESGFDYAAFGHNHDWSGILHAGDTTYACTGCFTGRTSDEEGTRGWLLGEVEKGHADMRFMPSRGVVFQTITLDISDIRDDPALGSAVAAQLPPEHAQACLTLELTGERGYEPDLVGLRDALSKVCLHAVLHDHTTHTLDLWRYEAQDDLYGAVTRRFRARHRSVADDDAKDGILRALSVALAALDGADMPL